MRPLKFRKFSKFYTVFPQIHELYPHIVDLAAFDLAEHVINLEVKLLFLLST